MVERFSVSGDDMGKLDVVLNRLAMVELRKLVQWRLNQRTYPFDATPQADQVFQLLQNADSENWLAELVVKLDEIHHSRMTQDLAGLVDRAKKVLSASMPATRSDDKVSASADSRTRDTRETLPEDSTSEGSSPGSDVLLTAELLAMEAEFYSTRWWNKDDLGGFVDHWQDLLPRAHAAVTDWRRTPWRPSPNADVRQLSILDAIEVATQAFDQAQAALIALVNVQHRREVSARVFVARRAIRYLIVAVEDVVNLRAGAADDTHGVGMCDGPPLSIPTAALTDAAARAESISILPTALRAAAPFVAAVAYYVPRTVRSSDDSLAAIARLVGAIGSCVEGAQHHMTLTTLSDDASRWRSTARQLSEDVGNVLNELNIYWQVRRRQEEQDLVQRESPEQLEPRLRELAESRDRLSRSFRLFSRHLGGLCSGFTSVSDELPDRSRRARDDTGTEPQADK